MSNSLDHCCATFYLRLQVIGASAAFVVLSMFLSACTGMDTVSTDSTRAEQRRNIETDFEATLIRAQVTAPRLRELTAQAAGVMIFPIVTTINPVTSERAGNGALREGGVYTGHYRVTASLDCVRAPEDSQSIIVVFTTRDALNRFRRSKPWRLADAVAVLPESVRAPESDNGVLFMSLEQSRFVALSRPCSITVAAREF
jgi:lipid-binding SYLF domain-containing protein